MEADTSRRSILRASCAGALTWAASRALGFMTRSAGPAVWVADPGARRAWLLDEDLLHRAWVGLPRGADVVLAKPEGLLLLERAGQSSRLRWRRCDRSSGWSCRLAERTLQLCRWRSPERPRSWVRLEASGHVVGCELGPDGVSDHGRLYVDGARAVLGGPGGELLAVTQDGWIRFQLGDRPGILERASCAGRVLHAARAGEDFRVLVERGSMRFIEAWSAGLERRFRASLPKDAQGLSVDPEGAAWCFRKDGALVRTSHEGRVAISAPRSVLKGTRCIAGFDDVVICGLWGALVGFRWPQRLPAAARTFELGPLRLAQGGFSWIGGLRSLAWDGHAGSGPGASAQATSYEATGPRSAGWAES